MSLKQRKHICERPEPNIQGWRNKEMGEMIRYLIFGGLTTVVNWIVYCVTLQITGNVMLVSNSVAWFFAVLFAYVTNKKYVFENRTGSIRELLREFLLFVGGRAASGVVEIFLPELLIKIGLRQEIFGIYGAFAKGITSVLVILINYFFSKVVVFRKNRRNQNK